MILRKLVLALELHTTGERLVLGSDRVSRICGIELSEAKEVAIKVDIVIAHLDLPVTKRIVVELRQELRIATFELNQRARGLTSVA